MERLILMRHGDAERGAPGLEDFERDLTQEGRAESRGVGRALAEAGLAPDLGLVSAARRAAETWREAAQAFPAAGLERDDGLYAASSARLAAAARAGLVGQVEGELVDAGVVADEHQGARTRAGGARGGG